MSERRQGPVPPEYVAEHVRHALTTDARVHEQGLDVAVIGDVVVVRGTVATAALRDAVAEVVAEQVPGAEVVNDVDVAPNPEPGAAEDLS
ncbi:MAG TPA: BON domain-containing protein [Acidimicrobiales bacterium]